MKTWFRSFLGTLGGLLHLCNHKWQVIDTINTQGMALHCRTYVLQCEHCGDIKVKKV